jgi:hypothetical protein
VGEGSYQLSAVSSQLNLGVVILSAGSGREAVTESKDLYPKYASTGNCCIAYGD